MDPQIIEMVSRVTEEEKAILSGRTSIDRDLYMREQGNTVNAQKLLSCGKLITLRTHTRFIHFPQHTHDYVEVVYMCSGQTTHIVNEKTILLQEGELLLMNQCATHEILLAQQNDVAVNIIVLPEFFGLILEYMGEEETPLRRFLVDCLCGSSRGTDFLHFKVSEIIPIQNLIENLLFALLFDSPNKQKTSQMTMTLLFMQLISHTEKLGTVEQDQAVIFKVLAYVESNYVSGSLTQLAELLHYDLHGLSREIKRKTGKNYTQLVQEKRLAQAKFLLKNTDRNVSEIARAVGYENIGYFYHIFKDTYGLSPRNYRLAGNIKL